MTRADGANTPGTRPMGATLRLAIFALENRDDFRVGGIRDHRRDRGLLDAASSTVAAPIEIPQPADNQRAVRARASEGAATKGSPTAPRTSRCSTPIESGAGGDFAHARMSKLSTRGPRPDERRAVQFQQVVAWTLPVLRVP